MSSALDIPRLIPIVPAPFPNPPNIISVKASAVPEITPYVAASLSVAPPSYASLIPFPIPLVNVEPVVTAPIPFEPKPAALPKPAVPYIKPTLPTP